MDAGRKLGIGIARGFLGGSGPRGGGCHVAGAGWVGVEHPVVGVGDRIGGVRGGHGCGRRGNGRPCLAFRGLKIGPMTRLAQGKNRYVLVRTKYNI